MKKYPVKKTFIDKHTKEKHKKGSKYECNAKRGKELQELGYLGNEIKAPKQTKKVDKDESK